MPFIAQTMQVGQLLANPFVIVAPSYQRLFAWTEEEAGKLLEDISSALDAEANPREGGEYFLGTMLFVERVRLPSRLKSWPRARPNRTLDVVDGFQRLTTLTILFCVLRDLDDDDGKPANPRVLAAITSGQGANTRHRLSLKGPEEEFFHAHVRAPGATRTTPQNGNLSPAEARILAVRDHFVATLADYAADERRQLADFLLERCCFVHVATTDIDRAHRMFTVLNARGKPLARNDILKADLLGRVPAAALVSATAIWDEAEGRLGEHFEQLFSHIRVMYGRPDDQVIAGIMHIAGEKGGEQAFVERVLQPAARILTNIRNARHEGRPQSAAIARLLRYLGWHSFADWIPPAMLWWLEKGEDAEGLARFLGRLDRLAFGIRILGIGGSKRARRFGAVVTAIRDGHGLDGPESPLEFTRQELRTMQHNLRDLHARNAPAAKHLLMRLAEQKAGAPQSPLLPSEVTVEHVLPRKLSASSRWRDWHPDPEEREHCTESLGNLVLVTKGQNDRAGNLDLARKLDVYFNTPGAPIPVINEDLRGRAEWKPAQIKAREAELIQLIEELWKFDLPKPRESGPEPGAAPSSRGRRRSKKSREERDGPAP